MDRKNTINLLDGSSRRRAAIAHCLGSEGGVHVEPFEDVSEICGRWPRSGLILVYDDGLAVGELAAQMERSGSWLPLIAYAEEPESRQVARAVLEGAVDYLTWPFGTEAFGELILTVEARAATHGSVRLRGAAARNRVKKLTRREREVLTGVAAGLSSRMIGERLDISPRTVEIHRANMLNKMGATSTSEAIRIAIESGLVT